MPGEGMKSTESMNDLYVVMGKAVRGQKSCSAYLESPGLVGAGVKSNSRVNALPTSNNPPSHKGALQKEEKEQAKASRHSSAEGLQNEARLEKGAEHKKGNPYIRDLRSYCTPAGANHDTFPGLL